MSTDTVCIASRRVITPEGMRDARVHVRDGKIIHVESATGPARPRTIDFGEAVIMPGIVDTHVHINEPGRTEWEGFQTATRAAAVGGVTTLVDMPLNSIPATTNALALDRKRLAARGQIHVDVGFWGGVIPGNQEDLAPLVGAGARGFKCFLVESGVDEFPCVGEADLAPAMATLARLGVPLLVHAEVAGPIDHAAAGLAGADPRKYATYLASRPPEAEAEAIALMVRLCRDTQARVHVVHHSAAGALDLLKDARAAGLPVTAETCPHYLHFAAEDIPDGATQFKCAPPIRERANREQLWQALADGVLDMVASDHSPCTPALKAMEHGDFVNAWGGVSGLQLALPVVWTEARKRGLGLTDLVRWMCERPARLAGLVGQKGALVAGADADLVVWDPDGTFTVEPSKIEHRHKVTPYAGQLLHGVIEATFLRGQRVYDKGGVALTSPRGQLL
jgi:allantoinase